MKCKLCDVEMDIIVLIPLRQPDGALEILVCRKCALKQGMYCKRHERPHLGFEDGSHACVECIKERVQELRKRGEGILKRLSQGLSPEVFKTLTEWAEFVSEEMKEAWLPVVKVSVPLEKTSLGCILRAIATRSLCANEATEAVIEKAITCGTIDSIVPPNVRAAAQRLKKKKLRREERINILKMILGQRRGSNDPLSN